LSQITIEGGIQGYQKGGAGQLFIKQTTATYGDLFSVNSYIDGASTTQSLATLNLNSLTLARSNYVVSSTNYHLA
jgi:hypothetical protein